LGNKFLYACVKEICHLWPQPRWQLLGARSGLYGGWSNDSQLKCSSRDRVQAAVLVCRHPGSHRNTMPDVSIPCLLFWMALHSFLVFHNTLLTLLWSLVAWIPQSALLSCSSKQLASAFW
jgi:hypothetical protein